MVDTRNGTARHGSLTPVAPLGISVGLGTVAVLVTVFVGALVPAHLAGGTWALLAVVVAGFAAWAADVAAAVLVAALTFVVANGFLVNRHGELSWHGAADLHRGALLLAAAAVGLVVARVRARRIR
jgi:hypothetical protein